MYTIKDLRDGRCVVVNDGSAEELREVIRLAFGIRINISYLDFKYYYSIDGQCTSSSISKYNIPIQSVKDFLKKDYPKVMWVSNNFDFTNKQKRVVYMEKNGYYIAWSNRETIEAANQELCSTSWPYAKDIEEEPKEYTMQEIANVLKIDVKDLKIKR